MQHPLLALLLGLALLASAGAASAEAASTDGPKPARRTLTRSIGEPGSTRPSPLYPVQGLHASTLPIAALSLWAEGHGFSLTRRSAMYDIEGGAALQLDDHVHLTASYRMLGIDLGFDSDVEGADGEPGIAAPFIGLAIDF